MSDTATLSGTITVTNPPETYTVTIAASSGGATKTETLEMEADDGASKSTIGYEIGELLAGTCTVTFEGDTLNTVTDTVELSAGQTSVLNVQLEATATLTGEISIIGASSGSHYLITITALATDGTTVLASTTAMVTGESGSYSVSGIPPGNCSVKFQNPNIAQVQINMQIYLHHPNNQPVTMYTNQDVH